MLIYRDKLAQDEPKCAVLRTENEEITAYLISCKERQMAMLEVIKSLKQEKASYLKRKVSRFGSLFLRLSSHRSSDRRVQTRKLNKSMSKSVVPAHELFNPLNVSNGILSLWAALLPRTRRL